MIFKVQVGVGWTWITCGSYSSRAYALMEARRLRRQRHAVRIVASRLWRAQAASA